MAEERQLAETQINCRFLPNYIAQKYSCVTEFCCIDRTSEFVRCHDQKESITMRFISCKMIQLPSAVNVLSHMPNLKELEICRSQLPPISKDDFEGFECLNTLKINFCTNLLELPGNLFEHTPNLEWIYFDNNMINKIGEDILEPLKNLQLFLLSNNPGIDAEYRAWNWIGLSLDEFKEAIQNCGKVFVSDILNRYYVVNEIETGTDTSMDNTRNYSEDSSLSLSKSFIIESLLEEVVDDKDFTIKVNEKSFKVNKAILAAKSVKMAKLFKADKDIKSIELQDITEFAAEAIALFLNEGKVYNSAIHLVEFLDAILKLQITELAKPTKKKLLRIIDPHNAFDVLMLCNKYDLEGNIKANAFVEFTKNFPRITLSPVIASYPEKLKQLMKTKLDEVETIQEECDTIHEI